MKIEEINSYRKDSNILKWALLVLLLISVLGNVFMYQQNIDFMKSIGNKRIVVDKENNTWVATFRELTTEERKAQLAKHVEMWADLFWQQRDPISYDKHMDNSLNMGGESIEGAYKYYFIDKGIERRLKENNWKTEIHLMNPIQINMTTTPISGIANYHWILLDAHGGVIWTRNMNFKFTVRDVSVTYDNPMGAFLEIDVFDDTKIGTTDKSF